MRADADIVLLDPPATPLVIDTLRASHKEAGIKLRVHRERDGEEMRTVDVEEVAA